MLLVFEKMALKVNSMVPCWVAVVVSQIFKFISEMRRLRRISYMNKIVVYGMGNKEVHIRNFNISISFRENGTDGRQSDSLLCCGDSITDFYIYL